MSEYPSEQEHQTGDQVPEEEFITNQEVDQEVVLDDNDNDGDFPVDEDDLEEIDGAGEDAEDEEDTIEIDMSNNSIAYFDKHTDSVFTIFAIPHCPWCAAVVATTQRTCGRRTRSLPNSRVQLRIRNP